MHSVLYDAPIYSSVFRVPSFTHNVFSSMAVLIRPGAFPVFVVVAAVGIITSNPESHLNAVLAPMQLRSQALSRPS